MAKNGRSVPNLALRNYASADESCARNALLFSFTKEFPTVKHLADASEEKVLKLWQGLGYYSRARNLHKTAQYISNDLNGVFPDSYKELLKLKGVGEYTAAAIASFSYNESVPVVDGNVFRVLARYFDIESDIALPATKRVCGSGARINAKRQSGYL